MTTNSIQYIANDKGSYTSLANFAVTLGTDVTLFPDYNTIVLSEASANDAGAYIDKEGLNFHIEPIDADDADPEMLVSFRTADAATLRRLAERLIDQKAAVDEELANVRESLTKARNDVEMYSKWYRDELATNDRVKSQIQAIAVLYQSIFADK
nr:MAG TPA: Protein of unknown function (DUF3801) [Caudoviricetes sp.]